MTKTSRAKRIEVLVDVPLLKRVKALAEEAGISGYTVLPALEGMGMTGPWFDERVSGGAGSRVIFLTVASTETAARFIELIAPILDSHGLVLVQGDVEVLRSSKFA